MRLLIVEDEEKLAQALERGLTKKGYAVDTVTDGSKAFNRITLNHADYDLIVLDLMLPSMDGSDITKGLRELDITVPILILTARDEIDNKVDLLLSGADDYLVKPFSFDELHARIRALLRRPAAMTSPVLRVGELELNPTEHKVYKEGTHVPLTLKEFMMLEHFMQHPDEVVNREELLSHLWDFNYDSFSNVVDVHVKNLRRKLNTQGRTDLFETIRGVGYRFKK